MAKKPFRVTDRVELIFSHAVAMSNRGRFKCTVHCKGYYVYIYNMDHTVLMRFTVSQRERFPSPVSFDASDYDSPRFTVEDGFIRFVSGNDAYKRIKTCKLPGLSAEEVEQLWDSFQLPDFAHETVVLTEDCLELIEDNLSHVEIGAKDGRLYLIQRNIYTGAVNLIQENSTGLLDQSACTDFGPVAIRTEDFKALFAYASVIDLQFLQDKGYVWLRSLRGPTPYQAVVGLCKYDEMGELNVLRYMEEPDNGRQESKERRGESETSGENHVPSGDEGEGPEEGEFLEEAEEGSLLDF